VGQDSCIQSRSYGTELIHTCDMTHSYGFHSRSRGLPVWINQVFMNETHLTCVKSLIHMCDVTHSYVGRDIFMCVWRHLATYCTIFICATWLIHIWDMTHPYETWLVYMRHDSFTWDMTHSYGSPWRFTGLFLDSFVCIYMCIYVYTYTHAHKQHKNAMSMDTHVNMYIHVYL